MPSMISSLSVIPIHWLWTVDSEMACCFLVRLVRLCLFSLKEPLSRSAHALAVNRNSSQANLDVRALLFRA